MNFLHSEEEVKDGMDLALCCLDLKGRVPQYAGANNSLYYIRNEELNEIKPDKQPVGRKEDRHPFIKHGVHVKTGDYFYIFSDGYADQIGGPKGKKFMYRPFKEILLANHTKSMGEQKIILEEKLEQWKGDLDQVDDICIIGLRIT